MKSIKGYKTVAFAAILAALGAAQLALPSLQGVITPAQYGWATMAVSVIVVVLRAMTTTALGEK